MQCGESVPSESRDKKYLGLEASILYGNSRTWSASENEKGSGDEDRLLGINSLGGHRPDPPTTEHLPSPTPFSCTTRYKLQNFLLVRTLQLNFSPDPLQFDHFSKMVWLPWSSGDSNKNAASDGGRIAPDRTSRARCWEGRDHFFACLDKNDILDAIKDDKKARQKCASEVAEFEAACSQSWVRII